MIVIEDRVLSLKRPLIGYSETLLGLMIATNKFMNWSFLALLVTIMQFSLRQNT